MNFLSSLESGKADKCCQTKLVELSHYFLVFSEIASVESMIPVIQVVALGREHFISSLWVLVCSYLNNVSGERGSSSPPTGGRVGRFIVLALDGVKLK